MTRPLTQRDTSWRVGLVTSPTHACAYLPDRDATTAFIDPAAAITNARYTRLAEIGFRRSGPYVYRPSCRGCDACVPVRIPVRDFVHNRREKRIWNRNRDLSVAELDCGFRDDHFDLYSRYLKMRHPGGGMDDSDPEQYLSFMHCEWGDTRLFEFRCGSRLLAVAVTDRLLNGLSAVYTFFDPDERRRSPGIYAILWQVDAARRHGLDWLYLGYWIRECNKMRYKAEFRPLQAFRDGHWSLLE